MVDNRVESLHPEFQPIALDWRVQVWKRHKIDARFTETMRALEREKELLASGASSVAVSYHNVGLAFDFLIYDGGDFNIYGDPLYTGGKAMENGDDPRYDLCGAVAAELGCKYPIHLASGVVDHDHVEYHPGFNLKKYLAAQQLRPGFVALSTLAA